MIALWMAYATVITLILSIAAALLDRAAAATIRQRRWVWAGALLLSVAIPAWTTIASRLRIGLEPRSVQQPPVNRAVAVARSVPTSESLLASLLARAE